MIFPPPNGLTLWGLVSPGVPNEERVIFYTREPLNLAPFAVLVGVRLADGTAIPLWDNFYWFGEVAVVAPSWVFLYTRAGQNTAVKDGETGVPVYSFFWGKPSTVFSSTNVVPMLLQIGGLAIGTNPLSPSKVEYAPAVGQPRPSMDALNRLMFGGPPGLGPHKKK